MTTYYHIMADFEICGKIHNCLVYGWMTSEEKAKEVLNRILNNPTELDLMNIHGATNLHIETDTETPWWWEGTN